MPVILRGVRVSVVEVAGGKQLLVHMTCTTERLG